MLHCTEILKIYVEIFILLQKHNKIFDATLVLGSPKAVVVCHFKQKRLLQIACGDHVSKRHQLCFTLELEFLISKKKKKQIFPKITHFKLEMQQSNSQRWQRHNVFSLYHPAPPPTQKKQKKTTYLQMHQNAKLPPLLVYK